MTCYSQPCFFLFPLIVDLEAKTSVIGISLGFLSLERTDPRICKSAKGVQGIG